MDAREGKLSHVPMLCSACHPHRAGRAVWSLLVLVLSLPLTAAHADAAYELGIDAFNRGDFEAAVTHFLASQADAPDNAALQYNLGVSYYKLGRYHEAGEAFLRVTTDPDLAAVGYYNLALVNVRLDQPERVTAWLQRCLDTTDNPKLRALAQTLLAQQLASAAPHTSATPTAPDTVPTMSPWSGFLLGEVGYDSNVILLSDSQTLSTSEQDDFFLDLSTHMKRQFRTTGSGLQLSLEAAAYVIKYQDIDGYDLDSLRVGGTLGKELGDWSASSSIHLGYSFLDGDDFAFEPQFSVSATRWLADDSWLRLRYEASRIDSQDPRYGYLDGWRHKTDARLTWLRGGQQLHVMYQYEANYREELDTPLFTSYSPIRNSLRLGAERPLGGRFDAAVEAQYYHSRYLNPNELAGGGTLTRRDERLSTVIRLNRRLSGGDELSIEYRRNDNRSNIDDYDYRQYLIMLGLLLAF